MRYRTFRRSATSFEEFAKAEKIIESVGLTLDEARQECEEFNNNRTPEEIRKGTKLEYESM